MEEVLKQTLIQMLHLGKTYQARSNEMKITVRHSYRLSVGLKGSRQEEGGLLLRRAQQLSQEFHQELTSMLSCFVPEKTERLQALSRIQGDDVIVAGCKPTVWLACLKLARPGRRLQLAVLPSGAAFQAFAAPASALHLCTSAVPDTLTLSRLGNRIMFSGEAELTAALDRCEAVFIGKCINRTHSGNKRSKAELSLSLFDKTCS